MNLPSRPRIIDRGYHTNERNLRYTTVEVVSLSAKRSPMADDSVLILMTKSSERAIAGISVNGSSKLEFVQENVIAPIMIKINASIISNEIRA